MTILDNVMDEGVLIDGLLDGLDLLVYNGVRGFKDRGRYNDLGVGE